MRVVVATCGSRGDTQPMLALALALQDAGHSVTFCATPDVEDWARSLGLRFQGAGTSMEAMLREIGLNIPKALRAMQGEVSEQFKLAGVMREADVIVGASLHGAGASLAERYGIPYFYTLFSPTVLASRFHPSLLFPLHHLPPAMNALSWRASSQIFNVLFRPRINEERRRIGLSPIRDVWEHLQSGRLLYATESAIAPLPADAPAGIGETGPWILPETDDLAPELEAFLQAGPPPVYIGFGSMPDKEPERTSRLIVEAIRRAGVRALLSAGWAQLGARDLPPTIRIIGSTPHGRLFPRLAAIVHHGGAGTTAAAARAGVPQVVVPHAFDQFYYANRVHQLGLSPEPIPRGRLTAPRLAAAIQACVSDDSRRARAQSFAATLTRDGVNRAVREIEAAVRSERPFAQTGS